MQAVFLCGGAAADMYPIDQDVSLLQFLGQTLLQHHIDQAVAAGVEAVVVVAAGPGAGRAEEVARGHSRVRVAAAEGPSAWADALRSARPFLGGEVVLVDAGCILAPSAYDELRARAQKGQAPCSLVGRTDDGSSAACALLHPDGASLLEALEAVAGPEANAMAGLAQRGHGGERVPCDGCYGPIARPWHVLGAMERILDGCHRAIAPSAQVSERATVEGSVVLAEGVRVFEGAVIRGPCYIGARSVVGNGALVRDHCHVGSDCVVGFATEVARSYVGDGCLFHRNYIGDSVIADRCSFGAGTVTANLRFDEGTVKVRGGGQATDSGLDKLGAMIGPGCKTGINASIMPGVRIGRGSIVGPHVLLAHDLEPYSSIQLDTRGSFQVKRRESP